MILLKNKNINSYFAVYILAGMIIHFLAYFIDIDNYSYSVTCLYFFSYIYIIFSDIEIKLKIIFSFSLTYFSLFSSLNYIYYFEPSFHGILDGSDSSLYNFISSIMAYNNINFLDYFDNNFYERAIGRNQEVANVGYFIFLAIIKKFFYLFDLKIDLQFLKHLNYIFIIFTALIYYRIAGCFTKNLGTYFLIIFLFANPLMMNTADFIRKDIIIIFLTSLFTLAVLKKRFFLLILIIASMFLFRSTLSYVFILSLFIYFIYINSNKVRLFLIIFSTLALLVYFQKYVPSELSKITMDALSGKLGIPGQRTMNLILSIPILNVFFVPLFFPFPNFSISELFYSFGPVLSNFTFLIKLLFIPFFIYGLFIKKEKIIIFMYVLTILLMVYNYVGYAKSILEVTLLKMEFLYETRYILTFLPLYFFLSLWAVSQFFITYKFKKFSKIISKIEKKSE